ncbi:acyl-CoA dehydrogenase family protein [Sediminicoccus rosea]|jgi:alkylation response protein AidB-like acyl-CoA dehydrogenase|uniref:Acyl-CoA dehydrogenase family protein n=1 Tax=Sediminicoccus rosea TaxID=1225128 RepID=A0ABZ0PDS3_9PROT|nr:acyl-CoA dehydrogenase family protein [Sediminicoccus rosea]WPB83848.1 acyl-CoA dehydrogenase family protein [Sediminicoccus rosea]
MDAATIDYDAFREEVREFALTRCPAEIRAVVATYRKLSRKIWYPWQRILFEHGWGAPSWPREFGGTGWDQRQRVIFDEVMAECDCPPQYHHGLRHLGPVIIEFGTPEQQARFLPGILNGEDWWCQGYSEPGAGSDLASLRTTARLEGDEYVVEGQKTWTSHAHEADWMYTLVRTSKEAKKQQGISLLLIPLNSAGITIRPIRTIDGWHHVNEVFLDQVRVPVVNRIGAEGQGWTYGKFLLERERLGGANIAPHHKALERVRALVAQELKGEGRRAERELLQHRLLRAEAELLGASELGRESVEAVIEGRSLGMLPAVIKLSTSVTMQTISQVALDAVGERLAPRFRRIEGEGPNAEAPGIEWVQNYMYARVRTIYGGSSEVQKNVIAKQLFGM